MNWLTTFVRPRIQTLLRKKDVPENLWHKCPACEHMVFHRDLEKNLFVCPHCAHHVRIGSIQRLAMFLDAGVYTRIELPQTLTDPLRFRDIRRYTERLKDARAKTNLQDAIVVAHGKMGGLQVVVAVFDFEFMGGSMGLAVGEGLIAASKLAVLQGAPLIVFAASGGARMQEGILSLVQMPRTTIAVTKVKEAGLPYIVVLTDPTTGGVSASFAMLGDVTLAEPGAMVGFAGVRVIEETIREKLPEGFQRAEYLHEHGMIDIVVGRAELRETLIRTLNLLCNRGPAGDLVALPRCDLEIPSPEDKEKAEANPSAPAESEPAPKE